MRRFLAVLTHVKDEIAIQTPYNTDLVDEIRSIPGRRWDGVKRAWYVPVASEQQVREIVRQFYQIQGEPCYILYKTVRVRVMGGMSAGVRINGRDLFSVSSGYLDMSQPNDLFEILDYVGGFTDEYKRVADRASTFKVDYTLKLLVREDATWTTTRGATYEILSSDDSPLDRFLEELIAREGDF